MEFHFLFLNISNHTLFLVVEFLSTFILHVLLAIQDISKFEATSTWQMEIQLCDFLMNVEEILISVRGEQMTRLNNPNAKSNQLRSI